MILYHGHRVIVCRIMVTPPNTVRTVTPALTLRTLPPERGMRLSLRTKWTVVLLMVGAVPLLLFALVGLHLVRRHTDDVERDLEIAIADHASDVFLSALHDAAEATHRVGRLLTEGSVGSDEARLDLARESMSSTLVLEQVAIYSPEGKLLDVIERTAERAPAAKGERPADRAPAAEVPEEVPEADLQTGTEGVWLAPAYGKSSVAIHYLEQVMRDGERRAWVLGTLNAGALSKRFGEISRDRFNHSPEGLLLVDRDARIVLSGSGGALAPGEPLAGRDIFRNNPLHKLSREVARTQSFTGLSGEAMVGTVRTLPDGGFTLVLRRPEQVVYSHLHEARTNLLIAAGIIVLLALVFGAQLAARTTEPIEALMRLAGALGQRHFGARSTVRTGDELEDLGNALSDMAQQLQTSDAEIGRRAAVEADLSRFLPAEVARSIAAAGTAGRSSLKLGGERREISVLFADVVSFTTFAEGAPPERVVAFLNELFTVLTEVFFRHGGTVDKFIGDCVMVIFGAPAAQPDHAQRALSAAEDVHRFVEASAPAWKEKYGVEVRLGVGVNTGEALVGNLGSESRMEYTAIGDVVNVASRVESMARPGQTLLTGEVARRCGGGFSLNALGEHPLRGKRQAVQLFELT